MGLRQFLYPAEVSTQMSKVLRSLVNSARPAISADNCRREFQTKYPDMCVRHGLTEDELRAAFQEALRCKFGGR